MERERGEEAGDGEGRRDKLVYFIVHTPAAYGREYQPHLTDRGALPHGHEPDLSGSP